jgi:NAD(P)-dependent dehydrogenase (short-subunit alcohol dehydrogenase family)
MPNPNSTRRPRALITGASSGIGRATALRFAADGFDVCVNARRETRLSELLKQLAPGDHIMGPGEYQSASTAERLTELIGGRWGGLEVLVNCAGVFQAVHPIDTPMEEWRMAFDIMFEGGIRMTRLAVPFMKDGGRIIHITSIHGERAEAGSSAYAMAKAALNQFCRGLAVDLAARKILVNAIAPGFIRTEMSVRPDGIDELETDWFRNNYVTGHHLPLRRAGEPEEIAGVAAFLAGPDATYITGQVITVDGGLTITF